MSLPSRGAWIEIHRADRPERAGPVAPLAGSVDRNLWCILLGARDMVSLPSRGAWIEIFLEIGNEWRRLVAPLAGSVDRNRISSWCSATQRPVAPLAGSVDRNRP